ncbi:MAG: hypothetical protein AAGT88_07775, partial [Dethiobacter sp.]
QLDQKITQLDQKLDQKITQLDQKLEQRFDQFDQKIEGLGKWIMAILLAVAIAAVSILAGRII